MSGTYSSDAEAQVIVCVIVAVALLLGLLVQCLFLRSLAGSLRECDEQNRTMTPGQVWLNLIPLFGVVWMFVTVNRVADSLKAEFDSRGHREDGDYGRGIGVAYNVLNLLSILPFIGSIMGVVAFVLWVTYWSKVSGYRKTLAAGVRYAASSRRRPAFG
jgi:hypothetical protein